ncbi:MAG: hypothetical protein ACIAQF_03235 [Phycisphaerales bacterium JB065]
MKRVVGLWCAMAGAVVLSVSGPVLLAQDAAEVSRVSRGIPRQNLFAQRYSFTLYEVEQFSERLGLTAEQHEIFVQMFSVMQERVMEAERPLREAEDEVFAFSKEVFSNEDSEWRQTPERFQEAIAKMTADRRLIEEKELEWLALQERLTAELIADLRLLLDAEQLSRWDDVHRWRHRARMLRWCMVPYASLFVSGIARSMELRPDPSRFAEEEHGVLEEIYEEYELALDGLLLERAAVEKEHAGMARGFGGDPDPISSFSPDAADLAWQEAVGEVNLRLIAMQRKYIRRIASVVAPDESVAFQDRCRTEAYPYVLGTSTAQKELEAMARDERLTDEQRARVEQLLMSYSSERNGINNRWVQMIEDLVARGEPRILASSLPLEFGDPQAMQRGESDLFETSLKRRALDEQWLRRVEELRAELFSPLE